MNKNTPKTECCKNCLVGSPCWVHLCEQTYYPCHSPTPQVKEENEADVAEIVHDNGHDLFPESPTKIGNDKPKYNSIRQVLFAANDIESKYQVIENLVDGILSAERKEMESLGKKLKRTQIDWPNTTDEQKNQLLANCLRPTTPILAINPLVLATSSMTTL